MCGVMKLTAEEGLHERYKELYLNKMSAKKSKALPEMYTHRPKLSEGTVKIAQKSRRRKMHEDKFVREAAMLEKASKIKAEYAKECTFKPKILEYRSNSKRDSFTGRRYSPREP